jgi:Protein of unknown function (DUF456).
MVEAVLVVAIALLIAGMVGSILPAVPAGGLSLAGIWVYAMLGSESLGPLALGALTLAAVGTIVVDHVGGPVAARLGGSSNRTAVLAGVAGLVLLFVLGPVGIIVGVVGTVFALERYEGADTETAAQRAVYTATGVLGSALAQLLLTGTILVAFVIAVIVL